MAVWETETGREEGAGLVWLQCLQRRQLWDSLTGSILCQYNNITHHLNNNTQQHSATSFNWLMKDSTKENCTEAEKTFPVYELGH